MFGFRVAGLIGGIYPLEMWKRSLSAVVGLAVLLVPMNSAQAAKKIAFSWSTTLTLTYEAGGSLKAGVNPSVGTLNSWASQICRERYDFMYAETVGASGRSLGKSSPKATKKSSKAAKYGWRMDDFGEREFFIDYSCSGSMSVPVTGPSNTYAIKAIVQDYNPRNGFKTKDGTLALKSRDYTLAELEANSWKITLNSGPSTLFRCCGEEVWGPIPKLAKIPNINFKFVESREFNEADQYNYGQVGKAYVFEIANYSQIEAGLNEFYLGLRDNGSYHGEKDDEALAEYDKESKQLTIFVPENTIKPLGTNVKMYAGHITMGFVRWHTSVDSLYVFNVKTLSITFKSSVEDIKNYPLYS